MSVTIVSDAAKPHLGGNVLGGDPLTYCPAMWDHLAKVLSMSRGRAGMSMIDVGCGEGHALKYFKNGYGFNVLGVEGLLRNVVQVDHSEIPVVMLDVSKGYFKANTSFDLCWCCEFVEHVEEKHIENVMECVINGRVVAMTHALPGQGGWHHVNCQDDAYWVNVFYTYGYTYLPSLTDKCRLLCEENNYFHQSGLVFRREGAAI